MYTLLVSGAASEQDRGEFRMERNRFLEYTDDVIASQLRPLSVEAIQCLQSWPCLLMDEGRGDQIAHIGRITHASATRREVLLNFEPFGLALALTNDDVWKLSEPLDIGDFEFNRNHIAIKDRDVLGVLARAGYDFGTNIRSQFHEKPLPAPARAELIRARDVIAEWGHTKIDDLLIDIGSSELGMNRGVGSLRDRANGIVRFSLQNPEAITAENRLLSAYLVRRALGSSDTPEGTRAESDGQRALVTGAPGADDAEPTRRVDQSATVAVPQRSPSRSPNRVFVVHGQNESARTAVVGYLREVGLEAIVLHDQPNMGRHLLTKFIQEAELVTFAVVLMTDDDVGCLKGGTLAPRARQNVILELGYFLAHLSQPRVCALITPGLETPSDFDGILYIRMDAEGNWRRELARELRAADMPMTDL
jgi:predicted nucleotide-binding protein